MPLEQLGEIGGELAGEDGEVVAEGGLVLGGGAGEDDGEAPDDGLAGGFDAAVLDLAQIGEIDGDAGGQVALAEAGLFPEVPEGPPEGGRG